MKIEEKWFEMQVTYPRREQALIMAQDLIQNHLAPCVQISEQSITSVYAWQGQMQESLEFVASIKIHQSRLEEVQIRIQKTHPYEVPQIIAWPIAAIEEKYLQWMDDYSKIS